jgi:hypothetical protein
LFELQFHCVTLKADLLYLDAIANFLAVSGKWYTEKEGNVDFV